MSRKVARKAQGGEAQGGGRLRSQEPGVRRSRIFRHPRGIIQLVLTGS